MSDFLPKLKELFSKKQISGVLDDFEKSSFFREQYLTQTFKTSDSRFKKKSYFLKNKYPIQLNEKLTKKLKNGEELTVIKENNKFSGVNTYINKWKEAHNNYLLFHVEKEKVFNKPLKKENIILQETKELKMFIDGSNEMPEQFEAWSAEKMYKEWLLLRLSNIEKPEWPIMNYVFFLFINQITCILNSYILYGPAIEYSELTKYIQYLIALDRFTKNGGLYKDLLNVHFLFCEWFDIRIKNASFKKEKRLVKINKKNNRNIRDLFKKNNGETAVTFRTIKSNNGSFVYGVGNAYTIIQDVFNETLNLRNFSLLVFTSYFQNPRKSNQLYSFPVISILGIPYKTHNGSIYTPKVQLVHDYNHLKDSLIPHFYYLYLKKTNSNEEIDDTKIFFKKMLFLMKLNESTIEKKELDNAHYFLWWYLHERQFLYALRYYKNKNKNNTQTRREREMLFFDISLFKSDLEKLLTVIKKNNFIDNINNFNQLISSINLLIQVCDETLDDSKKNVMFQKIINNTNAVKGNNNNLNILNNINKVNEKVDKYLKKHPEFTIHNLQEYANDYKIGKIYNTNNENNIRRFKVDFIKRVKDKHKIQKNISRYISKFIENNPKLSNNNINQLESLLKDKKKLEKLKKENPNSSNIELLHKLLQNFSNKYSIPNLNMDNNNNASTKKPITLRTLSNQRKEFIKGIVINPNGLPLNNNNPNDLPLNNNNPNDLPLNP
jgi:hypothetical protein